LWYLPLDLWKPRVVRRRIGERFNHHNTCRRSLMKRAVLGLGAALAFAVTGAKAQSVVPVGKPFSFGVAGGASVPTGDFGDGVKTGYNISALVEFRGPAWPVAIRVEGQWQQFDFKAGGGASDKLLGGLANVLYYFPSKGLVKPYVTGGLGVVNVKTDLGDNCSLADCSPSATKFAYDFGAGLQFQMTGISTFIEANWQSVQTENTAARMFPIRVGIKF
jgi:opacity protein-like surface antigen